MKYYIVNSLICDKSKILLKKYGKLIEIPAHANLPIPEKHHADMQIAKIDDFYCVCPPDFTIADTISQSGIKIFIGSTFLKDKYPNNISYNILKCGNHFFHNTDYTDNKIKQLIYEKGGSLHHIKQGYAGCSSAAIPLHNNKFLVLTSDKGVISCINNLNEHNIFSEYFDATKSIILSGYDHGFIGGCVGYDNDLGLIVYGKINEQLKKLSIKYNFPILSIFDGDLTDIGGISIMYSSQ